MMKESIFNRLTAYILTIFMILPIAANVSAEISVTASDAIYPYTLFSSDYSQESTRVLTQHNPTVNGNIATNGNFYKTASHVNGNVQILENAGLDMIYIFDKIQDSYFSGNNVVSYDDDYSYANMNINLNTPLVVAGELELTGNINLNSGLMAFENIELNGEVKNSNNTVIFSKYGDIVINNNSNVSLNNSLIYAPFGNVEINSMNVNINGIIIANSITFNCASLNANYNNHIGNFIGNVSELLHIPFDQWQYMKDENENGIPDFFEDVNNWTLLLDSDGDKLPDSIEEYLGTDPFNPDTDGDGLPDGYEIFELGTDPLAEDTDNNGVSDGDEDFDSDGLTNYWEYYYGTNPWNPDSDNDSLTDGEEIYTYGTDPLNPDTDGDGLSDGDEIEMNVVLGLFGAAALNPLTAYSDGIIHDSQRKFAQKFIHRAENKDSAVTEVIVSMTVSGNLQRTTYVKSMMGIDVLSSDVVGLVGDPFDIHSDSDFDEAVITFKIDQSKLPENTALDNLMFLWYDEENYMYVQLDTEYDRVNSSVSTTVTHFSQYMVVDSRDWFSAWTAELNYYGGHGSQYAVIKCHTVLVMDCSGSMTANDPFFNVAIPGTSGAPSNVPRTRRVNYRMLAAENFIRSMDNNDKAAVLRFGTAAQWLCEMTDNKTALIASLSGINNNSGGTNFNPALRAAVDALKDDYSATRKYIIFMSDGIPSDTLDDSLLREAKDNYIKIHTVGLGRNIPEELLKHIADETGGEYFKALGPNDLLHMYAQINFVNLLEDSSDSDGDGLPDVVETAGMRLQNGQIITTNPNEPDTDGDGLKDGAEIDPIPRQYYIQGMPSDVAARQPWYFVMYSNPLLVDTDGDRLWDNEDPKPLSKHNNGKDLNLTSEMLSQVQRWLVDLGYLNMKNNPYGVEYGPITCSAVYIYQMNHGFQTTAIVNGKEVELEKIDDLTYATIANEHANKFGNGRNDYYSHVRGISNKPYFESIRILAPLETPTQTELGITVVQKDNTFIKSSHAETFNLFFYDYTEILNKTMLKNMNYMVSFYNLDLSSLQKITLWLLFPHVFDVLRIYEPGMMVTDFTLKVWPNGDWDYKVPDSWIKEFSNIPYMSKEFPFIFRDEFCDPEIFGNINFGYVGLAIGFTEEALHEGANLISWMTTKESEPEEDIEYVRRGFRYYREDFE